MLRLLLALVLTGAAILELYFAWTSGYKVHVVAGACLTVGALVAFAKCIPGDKGEAGD